MRIDPEEITKIQDLLDEPPNCTLEMFNIWENSKDELKITIRPCRE